MGSWGHRSFDNDSALDWVGELEDLSIAGFRRALGRVAKAARKKYVEIDDAQIAVAAAEMVAAARGHRGRDLPEEVDAWLERHAAKLGAADAALARAAVERARDSSELQEVWAEDGAKNPWTREVARLLARLAARPKALPPRPRPKKAARRPPATRPAETYRSLKGPGGTLSAVGAMLGDSCIVSVGTTGGASESVFIVESALEDVAMRWADASTLAITYPARATVVRQDESCSLDDRTVRCTYRQQSQI